jgi:lysophospholipid acyltransferase (LPLAT)-like uncharacterized protein
LNIEGWPARLLIRIAYRILRLWESTLRYEVRDEAGILRGELQTPIIAAAWHNRLLMLPISARRFVPVRPGAALISASRDGGWIAELVKRCGFDVVRGSSSRQGVAAILQMSDVLASGRDVIISPDGPRGPVYQLGPGIIFLAQKSNLPVMPLHLEFDRCWRVKSWDGFFIPKPFSKTRLIFGQPHRVEVTTTDEGFEAERRKVENLMMSLVVRR